jgi:ribosome-associated toxin RatA of RatAB toxin-antitoxin module
MTEHHASVTVQAPVQQVYELFTHFDDFPKFMHFVKEVTYLDEQRTHWVVHVLRDHEWIAINEDWLSTKQIGWRSISGLKNTGKVKFSPLGPNRTSVDVYISYVPPTGPLGALVDVLSVSEYFTSVLREDLQNFAHMVEQAPPGALDPMSSNYLFHASSAVSVGTITARQKAAMERDPRMSVDALAERNTRLEQEKLQHQREVEEGVAVHKRQLELERKHLAEQQELVAREAKRHLLASRARTQALELEAMQRPPRDPIHDTLGGRGAATERTAAGDRDGFSHRFRGYEQDPMVARYPLKVPDPEQVTEEESKLESPWWRSIRGTPLPPPAE